MRRGIPSFTSYIYFGLSFLMFQPLLTAAIGIRANY